MWTCPTCNRVFGKSKQPHSCHKIPLEQHFKNKQNAKTIFDYLINQINTTIGPCQIISLPCCVHVFGKYDFLAALPKRNSLEIRFALNRKLYNSKLKVSVPVSKTVFKNCFEISTKEEINSELIGWLKQSYNLKN